VVHTCERGRREQAVGVSHIVCMTRVDHTTIGIVAHANCTTQFLQAVPHVQVSTIATNQPYICMCEEGDVGGRIGDMS
jgi:hypothetical protein